MAALGNELGDDVLRRDFVDRTFRHAVAGAGGRRVRGPRAAARSRAPVARRTPRHRHADVICGRGGDDRIAGRGGNDTIYGDAGNDRISAGDGHDTAYGDRGDDVTRGGFGEDVVAGGPGADNLGGGPGRDHLDGQGGGGRCHLDAPTTSPESAEGVATYGGT